MSKINDINDFESGQVFMTKKGKKMEVVDVHKDKDHGEELNTGSVEMKVYVHRDSRNCEAYGWGHNTKHFISCMRTEGKEGLLRKLQNEGWSLK